MNNPLSRTVSFPDVINLNKTRKSLSKESSFPLLNSIQSFGAPSRPRSRKASVVKVDTLGEEFGSNEFSRLHKRLRAARVSNLLTEQYERYNTYTKLLKCSSLHSIFLKAKSLSKTELDFINNLKKQKRGVTLSSIINKPTMEEQRNKFIWDELVKLNSSEAPETYCDDPVMIQIKKMKSQQQIVVKKEEYSSKSTRNSLLHFYCTHHNIHDIKTFITHKRPQKTRSLTRLQDCKRKKQSE